MEHDHRHSHSCIYPLVDIQISIHTHRSRCVEQRFHLRSAIMAAIEVPAQSYVWGEVANVNA